MMAGEEQRINCGGVGVGVRRKELEHGTTLEAILYNLTLGNNMSLDEGCRGDGVNQHPQITVSFEESPSQNSKRLGVSPLPTKGVMNNASNKHRSEGHLTANFLQVPQPDLSKLSVMPIQCHEFSH